MRVSKYFRIRTFFFGCRGGAHGGGQGQGGVGVGSQPGRHRVGSHLPALCCPQDAQEGQLCQEVGEGGAQEDIGEVVSYTCSAKVKMKSKKLAGKDKSADKKKVHTKGKRGARGKGEQRENRMKTGLKKTYLRKMEKLKTRRVQPWMKHERKQPSLIDILDHVFSVVPVSRPGQPRGIFLQVFYKYFVNASF